MENITFFRERLLIESHASIFNIVRTKSVKKNRIGFNKTEYNRMTSNGACYNFLIYFL
jgi:hypothetical protein